MAVGNLVSSILAVVFLIALGYLAKRTGLLSVENRQVINDIIIYLAMPALIFRAVTQSKLDSSLLKIPLLAIIVMLISVGAAFILGRLLKLDRTTFGALLLVSAVGNTGYLGYPLTINLFGQGNLVRAVFFDIFGSVLFVFTVGIIIAHRYGDGKEELNISRELFTFPPLVGLAAAFLLRGFSLPFFVTKAIGFMADATIPLIMLSIGLSIELSHIFEQRKPLTIAALVKLIFAPLIALVGVRALGFPPVDGGIAILEASMPAMMFSLIIGMKYGLDVEFLPAAIIGTTLLALLTVPIWQYAARIM
ncbi:MAG: AEC family transporter [Actinobacteria bacterium]|nr:AEC family transporter [Actinomycetota bacterium]